ncbi:hypothetical protein VTH06DRAFT_7880 [Thermothelomyces fergusii]
MAIDKKRKRIEGHGKRSKALHAGSKRQKSNSGKRVVNVDALPWKSVDVPEMFDDAEGFYGLEEVEGVEVVREGGTVKFVTAGGAELEDDNEEFGGFDDPPEISKTPPEGTEVKTNDDPELETNVFAQAASLAEAPAEDNEIDMSEWVPLGLSPQVLSAIARLKFAKPTAIQAKAIPHIMNGHDLIGKAVTGSGKTLAFGIPIVESWLAKRAEARAADKKQPIALILSPTRELAHQIRDHLKQLCAGLTTAPYVCSVTGGLAVQKQQRQFEKADILVGTPGRMWELMSSSNSVLAALRGISFLVVDEADRLLKDGHFKEAEDIMNALDRRAPGEDEDEEAEDGGDSDDERPRHSRQTLVFSATFNKNLQQKLAGKARYNLMGDAESLEYLLKKLNFREPRPKFVDANPISQMAEKLREGLIQCGDLEKDLYLYAVLLLQPARRALVFTNSINTVRRLTPFLQALNLPAFALHSEMEQKARLRSIERFKAGGHAAANNKNKNKDEKTPGSASPSASSSILVATDVAARGLDIPEIDLVVHYHVPRTADDYVHRSGRTARASRSGVSILLCGPKEAVPTQRLIAKVHAGGAAPAGAGVGVQTVDIDRRLVAHLRPRVTLAKKITETTTAKERGAREEDWLRKAADELGVEYDPDELGAAGSWKGRGSGRRMREKEAAAVSKAELKQWRWELKELLSKRVNTGVSEKYLNGVDVDALLRGARGEFLGQVEGLGL